MCKRPCQIEVNLMVTNLKHSIRKFGQIYLIKFETNFTVCIIIANLIFRPVLVLELLMKNHAMFG
jgi:hypothetical protein